MTAQLMSRERLEEIVSDQIINQGSEFAMLARMALAAMDSEPVAWISQSNLDALSRGHDALVKSTDNVVQPVPLYRHAQTAPVVQPVMFIDGDISTEDADKLAKVIREFNEEDERPLAKMARIIRENPHPINECGMPKAQKKPVVPEEAYSDDCPELYPSQPDAWAAGWNACRAAIAAATQEEKQ